MMPVDITGYKGPGIYNAEGKRIVSLHRESLVEYILQLGEFGMIETKDEYEDALEYVGKTPPEAIWTTPEDDWQDVVAPQIGTGRPDE